MLTHFSFLGLLLPIKPLLINSRPTGVTVLSCYFILPTSSHNISFFTLYFTPTCEAIEWFLMTDYKESDLCMQLQSHFVCATYKYCPLPSYIQIYLLTFHLTPLTLPFLWIILPPFPSKLLSCRALACWSDDLMNITGIPLVSGLACSTFHLFLF